MHDRPRREGQGHARLQTPQARPTGRPQNDPYHLGAPAPNVPRLVKSRRNEHAGSRLWSYPRRPAHEHNTLLPLLVIRKQEESILPRNEK